MLKVDKTALVCDLAETYHIYDYERLPARQVASFAVGLRDDSRIKLKLSGSKVDHKTLLLMTIVDQLNLLLWSRTKDAASGRGKPKSIVDSVLGKTEKQDAQLFSSKEEFLKERKRLQGLIED